MDPKDIYSAIMTMLLNSAKAVQANAEHVAVRSQNALNVIEDVLVLQLGGPGDDSGLIAALQAAAGTPAQGAITKP